MKEFSLLLAGVGGQGVLSIAEIILQACVSEGIKCTFYPTKGMAQRGGEVKAQLKLGNACRGPELSLHTADAAVSMEANETLKTLKYVKPGGNIVIFGEHHIPHGVMNEAGHYPSDETVLRAADEAGLNTVWLSEDFLPENCAANIFVLGVAFRYTGLKNVLSYDTLLDAVVRRFPKAEAANRQAFDSGYNYLLNAD